MTTGADGAGTAVEVPVVGGQLTLAGADAVGVREVRAVSDDAGDREPGPRTDRGEPVQPRRVRRRARRSAAHRRHGPRAGRRRRPRAAGSRGVVVAARARRARRCSRSSGSSTTARRGGPWRGRSDDGRSRSAGVRDDPAAELRRPDLAVAGRCRSGRSCSSAGWRRLGPCHADAGSPRSSSVWRWPHAWSSRWRGCASRSRRIG